jgi:lysophospholipase L1-like esterase
MLAGTHAHFRATIRRGLVYVKLLFESRPDGFTEVHRLNLYGFRGPDFEIAPPVGRRRMVVLGDSVTEGQGAPESGTITAELSRLLADDGISAEVLNLGVVAATLPHLAALARDATRLLRPTDVVLVLYANDLPAPPYPLELDQAPPRFPPRDTPWWLPRSVELVGRVLHDEPIYRRWPQPTLRFFAPVPDPSNPWTGSDGPPSGLDPALYQAMAAGALNPWLRDQAAAIPGMLAHDFAEGGSPGLCLLRVDEWCRSVGANLLVAYVPFCGVTHARYAPSLAALGMSRSTAEALTLDPIYRRQNALLADLCPRLGIPLADATEALAQAEAEGIPQYWSFDTHPRPSGYATIARHTFKIWRQSFGDPGEQGHQLSGR